MSRGRSGGQTVSWGWSKSNSMAISGPTIMPLDRGISALSGELCHTLVVEIPLCPFGTRTNKSVLVIDHRIPEGNGGKIRKGEPSCAQQRYTCPETGGHVQDLFVIQPPHPINDRHEIKDPARNSRIQGSYGGLSVAPEVEPDAVYAALKEHFSKIGMHTLFVLIGGHPMRKNDDSVRSGR